MLSSFAFNFNLCHYTSGSDGVLGRAYILSQRMLHFLQNFMYYMWGHWIVQTFVHPSPETSSLSSSTPLLACSVAVIRQYSHV